MSEKQTTDFDRNPPIATNDYDRMAKLALPGYEAMHQMAASYLTAQLPEKADLLIVGTGTGMELIKLGKINSQWEILGLDPSENMLAIAREKIEQNNLSDRVKLYQGYTQELPNTFLYDAATSILVMHFIPDDGSKLEFLKSISQLLKSSANFILVDVFGDRNSKQFERIFSTLKVYWQQMGIDSKTIETIQKYTAENIYPIPETRVKELLENAGFENITRFYTGLWVGGWIANKI